MALVFLGALLATTPMRGQTDDKAALQKEKDRITQQLETTENLLGQARRNRADASSQVGLLDQQIQLRKKRRERRMLVHKRLLRLLQMYKSLRTQCQAILTWLFQLSRSSVAQ